MYAYANSVNHLSGDTLQQTLCMYAGVLCIFWYTGLALSLLGVGFVFVERHVNLRATLDTEFGINTIEKNELAISRDVKANCEA